MTLLIEYEASCKKGEIEYSALQREAAVYLSDLAYALMSPWLFFWRRQGIQGVYVYGPVGVGKTYLLDLFYEHLTIQGKARYHFHHLMQQIDEALRKVQGVKNPVRYIAQQWSQKIRVLCLDEFCVDDVTHAMILIDFFRELRERGVYLVLTANVKPDHLYLQGLHRDRFLSVIEDIKTRCHVFNLHDSTDHRLGHTVLPNRYFSPLNATTSEKMNVAFDMLSSVSEGPGQIMVQNRWIDYVRRSDHVIWFEFNVICQMPRSSLDYLALSKQFHTFFVSGVPCIEPDDTTSVVLLVQWIDILYDHRLRLVLSAEGPIEAIYPQGPLRQTFIRTESRLHEMQSTHYRTSFVD